MTTETGYESWNGLKRSVICFRVADDLQALLATFGFLSHGLKHN